MGTLSVAIPLQLSLLFFYRSPVIANRIQRVVHGSSVSSFIDNFSACVNRPLAASGFFSCHSQSQTNSVRPKTKHRFPSRGV